MSVTTIRQIGLLSLLLLGSLPARAAEGRIPIPFTTPVAFPITIAAPGKYFLAGPLSAPGTILDITSPGEVDVDLNGFVTENTGPGAVILVAGGPLSHVTVRNGVVKGGLGGIVVVPGGAARVAIESVTVSDTGAGIVLTDVMSFLVRDGAILRTTSNALLADGGVLKQGTIQGNHVQDTAGGILVTRGSSVAILENRLERISPAPSPAASGGIILSDSDGCLVSNNTIELVEGLTGAGIRVRNTHGSKFYNNVIFKTRHHGMHLDATAFDNLVLNNVILHAGWDESIPGLAFGDIDEVRVEAGGNHLDRNLLNRGSGHGLHIGSGAHENHFGRNSAVGNGGPLCPTYTFVPTLDFCDENGPPDGLFPDNFSFGDNLMPGSAGMF